MIARVTIAVPFVIIVPEGATYNLYTYEDDGYHITARPPVKSDVPVLAELPASVEIDGSPAFAANALQFDIQKAEFDRKRAGDAMDPPAALLQRAVSGFISRFRYVARAAHVQHIDFEHGTTWRLQYLSDDGSELAEDPALVRGRGGRKWSFSFASLAPSIWDRMHDLPPDWIAPVWDDILLDASNALPNIGTAVVLAATALEVFAADVLERLAADGDVPAEVWEWINKREDWVQEPSTEEQFDVLLQHFSGHSLKEETKLWQDFKELRTARNKFVHEGEARVGGKPITLERAAQLVAAATNVIQAVRKWVPPERQWPQFDSKVQLSFVFPLTQ